ncbi:MAG TPA: hypothetical protein VES96_04210 [Nitrospiraceae bacterium]|nr:hypothetical protein [Nitrospiraceae bacterium]
MRHVFTKTVAVVLVVAFCGLTVVPPALAQERSNEETEGTPLQYGLGVASVFTSLPYSIGKFVFATMGGIFGGFTYLFSAGNEKAAKAVWDTSMRGTYVISPRHLKGEEPVRFFGVPPIRDEAPAATSMPEPAPAAPVPAPAH